MKKKPRPILPLDFETKMDDFRALAHTDPETAHSKADDLMCDTMKLLGYREGAKIFLAMPKWYA